MAMMTPISAHEQERAHSREIALGGVAPQAQAAEGCRRDEEHSGDALMGVDEPERGEADADQRRIDPEDELRCRHAHAVHAERKKQHQRQRREDYNPSKAAREQQLAEGS